MCLGLTCATAAGRSQVSFGVDRGCNALYNHSAGGMEWIKPGKEKERG
jgi:hypothetical protein